MNFLEIQNAVLTDRFREPKRAAAKRWINYRYGRVWASEDWAFKRQIATVTLNSGAQSTALTGFHRILGLWDSSTGSLYSEIDPIRPEDYYGKTAVTQASPTGFTIVGNTIYFDRAASGAKSYQVIGELAFTELSADGDVPLLPAEFHYLLVPGAIAVGLREENDPTWKEVEADFQAAFDDMKKGYLTQVRNYRDHYPSWPNP